jgi:hypothetical protein
MQNDTDVPLPRGELVFAAHALLMAASALDDLSHMDARIRAAMPADLRDRMQATYYQDSFDRLPEDIQAEARALALADPDIQTARGVDRMARP